MLNLKRKKEIGGVYVIRSVIEFFVFSPPPPPRKKGPRGGVSSLALVSRTWKVGQGIEKKKKKNSSHTCSLAIGLLYESHRRIFPVV